MTTDSIGLFKAMTAKMNYFDQRQRVISQNVANADTPQFRPMDLKPVDFGRAVADVTKQNVVRPAITDDQHMPRNDDIDDPEARRKRTTYEVAPAGNAVIIEEQMISAARTTMDYNLMTTLYQKNVGMIRTALGNRQ